MPSKYRISVCPDCHGRKDTRAERCQNCSNRYRVTASSSEEHFWSLVKKGNPDECWPWKGPRSQDGYGYINGRGAHRKALSLKLGRPLTKDEHALHSCDNPPCCNPAHLFPGTNLDNIADKIAKGRATPVPSITHPERLPRGSQHYKARLTEQIVRDIRRDLGNGISQQAIAERHNVKQPTISDIAIGKTWKHIL